MMKFFWHTDKHWSFLEVDTIILGGRSQACQKYPKWEAWTSLQYLQKEDVRDKVDFLPTDKHEYFLQVDSIILVVDNQACAKYPKK